MSEPVPQSPLAIESPSYQSLAAIWKNVLKLQEVDPSQSFFELGGTSVAALDLLLHIEQEFGMKLGLDTLFRCPTLGRLHQDLQESHTEKAPQLLRFKPAQVKGAKPPLFTIAHTSVLGDERPTYYFEGIYDSIHSRADALTPSGIRQVIHDCAADIESTRDGHAAYVQGYCHGGWIALALAQHLQSQGCPVGYVGLIETHPRRRFFRGGRLAEMLADLRRLPSRQPPWLPLGVASRRVRQELVASIYAATLRYTSLHSTPRALFIDVLQRWSKSCESAQERLQRFANHEAYRDFEKSVFWQGIDGDLHFFFCSKNEDATDVQRARQRFARVVRGPIHVHQALGDHWVVRGKEGRESIHRQISGILDAIEHS